MLDWRQPFVKNLFLEYDLKNITWDDIVILTRRLNKEFPKDRQSQSKVLQHVKSLLKAQEKIPKPNCKPNRKPKAKAVVVKVDTKSEARNEEFVEDNQPVSTVSFVQKPPDARDANGIPVYRKPNTFKLYTLVTPKVPIPPPPPPSTPPPEPSSSTSREREVLESLPLKKGHVSTLQLMSPESLAECTETVKDFRFGIRASLWDRLIYYGEDKWTVNVFNTNNMERIYSCTHCKVEGIIRDGAFVHQFHKDTCTGESRELFKRAQVKRQKALAAKQAAGDADYAHMVGFEVMTEEEFDIQMPDYPFVRDWYYRSPTHEDLSNWCHRLAIPFVTNMIKPENRRLYQSVPSIIAHITTTGDQCGYRALSLLISGTETNHESLRKSLIMHLASRNDIFIDNYPKTYAIARKKVLNTIAHRTEVLAREELAALSDMLGIHVFVFDADLDKDKQWVMYTNCFDQPEKLWYSVRTGILLYHKAGNYSAVLGIS